ncbi:hypothetical protein [Hafnia phage Pocis76]|uniref:Uncharacterized protein n=1 Tax=Hafnia phage Pocis76 TaxID=2831174 RepID=A0A8E7KYU0_9CAUD|nr:hypothetical protein [Hafnia phage Pocis76]
MNFIKSLFATKKSATVNSNYAALVNSDMAEKLWMAERAIKELREQLEKEKRAHHRTRNVYRNVINVVRGKMIDIDILISREAKKYDNNRKGA